MNDPKSATLAQIWEQKQDGTFLLQARPDGKGVRLKEIRIQITNEPVTLGMG